MDGKQISKICTKAAKVIERDGLCKGSFGSADGPKCALGALRFAASGSVDGLLPFETSSLFKKARPHSQRYTIVVFNDAPRTRKHDVVELLRDMAAVAKRS